jgi:hypothetical protein
VAAEHQGVGLLAELKRRNVFRVAVAYLVTAWLLLQVADIVLENTNAPEWIIQVFMLALAIGLPLALVFAWAFEVTPEGLKKEKDVDRSQSITRQTGRKLDRAIVLVLAVAVIVLLIDRVRHARHDEAPPQSAETEAAEDRPPSIAVLPFVNMSSDPEQEYFSDGISEEILNSLAKIKDLKVAGRTSPAVPPRSRSRARTRICARSGTRWAWSTFSRGRCAKPAPRYVSRPS